VDEQINTFGHVRNLVKRSGVTTAAEASVTVNSVCIVRARYLLGDCNYVLHRG
jgi:hypothetical protein